MIFVAFLFPLTLYCLILAMINGRPRPLMLSGVWDFAGVLFAASGFLLAGGPAVLTALDEHWRMFWLLGVRRDLLDLDRVGWLLSVTLLLGYFLFVLLGAALLLWRRRHTQSIYNVEPAAFETALAEVLQARGLAWSREGKRIAIEPPGNGREPAPLLLEVDAFPVMRHVLLRWRGGDTTLRHDIDEALRDALRRVQTPDNPAAVWFLWAGAGMFLLMFATLAVLLMITLFLKR